MSSSTPNEARFLLDENVRAELASFLKLRKVNFKLLPKRSSDRLLAAVSKREKRVLVTNDKDFAEYPPDKIFSVIWLRIPQKDTAALLTQFEKLITTYKPYAKRLITLNPDDWKVELLQKPARSRKTK